MFSDNLKRLRTERNVSQKKLAAELYMSQQSVAKWELDKTTPSPEMLSKIADYFGVTVDYLLGRETTQKEKPADNVGELMSPLDKELYDLLSTLSVEEKEMLLASIKAVKSRREQPASPQQ